MEEKAGRRNRLRCAASLLGRSEPAQRFTPVTGMPFNKNICRHRLALAPYDPTAVHERITAIALIYGDAAPVAFSRCFRQTEFRLSMLEAAIALSALIHASAFKWMGRDAPI